ncbi:MAG: DUF1572 family protein [Candidatus Latescibacteria bacterium]|jgi:hypothetical protein|nr:DUF1572 family protein [Candidatus Latescibacterota bacterium]
MNYNNFLLDYLEDAVTSFQKMKSQAESAIVQVSDRDFFVPLDFDANSVAHLMKHMAGNARSRWVDFLTSDGEKPNRNRDSEFKIEAHESREEITAAWETGWQILFDTLRRIEPHNFNDSVYIRNETHSIMQAINRQLTHYAYHVGQIVFIAKHHSGSDWHTLSIPRDESESFNEMMRGKNAANRK